MTGNPLQDWLRDTTPTPTRVLLRDAAQRTRQLGVALLRADHDGIDEADATLILADIDVALSRLRELARIPDEQTPAGTREEPTTLSERSPISGEGNIAAPPLRMEHRPGLTVGVARFSELHEGPGRHVHGGIIASTFDELLGVAQVHSGAAGYTAELTVRFHKIMPLFVDIVFEAKVLDRDDRRIRVEGRAHRADAPEVLLASAVGTFIAQAHLPIPEHLRAP